MNKHIQITSILIIVVILCSVLMIGGVWGVYLFDHSFSESSLTSGSSEEKESGASSSTEREEQTTGSITPEKPQNQKRIALTFDDGPSSSYTAQILDLLEQYHAKATFFVCGYQLTQGKQDILQRTIALGCEIGNHTNTHEKYLTKLSEKELLNEIRTTNEKISQLSGVNYNCSVYRPPWGEINRDVVETLLDDGIYMYSILWDVDSLDWSYRSQYSKGEITREKAVSATFETIVQETKDGSVILMHDIQSITPDVVKLVLEKYIAEGYEFVTVSELFGFENMQDEEAYFNRYRSTNSISQMK